MDSIPVKAAAVNQVESTDSAPANQQVLDLLQSIQQNQQRLEQRLGELERNQGGASQSGGATAHHDTLPSTAHDETFVGAIDQGTTSSRFLIFNKGGEPVASHQIEFKQIYPHPG